MIVICPEYIKTESRRVDIALRQNLESYCWSYQVTANYSGLSLQTYMEKKTFFMSKAAYQVPGAILISSVKDTLSGASAPQPKLV